jgi:hypothetical protein
MPKIHKRFYNYLTIANKNKTDELELRIAKTCGLWGYNFSDARAGYRQGGLVTEATLR